MDAIYGSDINRDVPPARAGEFSAVPIGPLRVWPPVVLAPMAGVTNPPFRTLCRRFFIDDPSLGPPFLRRLAGSESRLVGEGDLALVSNAGLYVSEMITARALVEGNRKTVLMATFGKEETTRSLQLYGVDPRYVGEAVRLLVGEGRVDHVDMNFGCPVRKVTSKGGGAAIPAKPRLLRAIVRAAVSAAGAVPVTLKFRIGIDERVQTYLDSGRIAQDEGCAAVGLHARTAAQLYDGQARWDAVAQLKQAVTAIPVLGNGDIWEAEDALRMMRATGCDGVIVGRGCLGRPWLFRDLADVFAGRAPANPPDFGGVVDVMLEHARLLAAWLGETGAMRAFRKHSSWYTKGFRGGAPLRERLMRVTRLDELETILAAVDRGQPFPPDAMRVARGKTAGTQNVALPSGYLDDLDDATPPGRDAEAADSGG
ncbi:MAG TPA: tRNA dihydrouridine synthase DusB [Vicinamibacteria bacterium]|nr:tRNA dihydrouridine synthase DusB [Vicinamibacteria bacterium]